MLCFNQKSIRRAFTLIELLIVIAIMLLLAGILFPVFSRAREMARRTTCASNLKQIGLGLLQYTQDYDEKYPFQEGYIEHDYSVPHSFDTFRGWIWRIQPYVKSWEIFRCPSVQDFPLSVAAPVGNSNASYIANGMIVRDKNNDGTVPGGASLAIIPEPSQTILVHEFKYGAYFCLVHPFNGQEVVGYTPDRFYEWLPAGDDTFSKTIDDVHFGGANLLFCDGHVKYRKISGITAREFGLTDVQGGPIVGITPDATSAAPLF